MKSPIAICAHCQKEIRPNRVGFFPTYFMAIRESEEADLQYFHNNCFDASAALKKNKERKEKIRADLLSWLDHPIVDSITDPDRKGDPIPPDRKWHMVTKFLTTQFYSLYSYEKKSELEENMEFQVSEGSQIIAIYRNKERVPFKAEMIIEVGERK